MLSKARERGKEGGREGVAATRCSALMQLVIVWLNIFNMRLIFWQKSTHCDKDDAALPVPVVVVVAVVVVVVAAVAVQDLVHCI